MFDATAIDAARSHAADEYPKESCGLIVDGEYLPRKNIHEDPENAFRMSKQAYAGAAKKGEIQAVIHSHPDGPAYPSSGDMTAQHASAVPWGIIVSSQDAAKEPFWFGDQVPMPPLLGRGFRHGVTDCYSLIRDWYRSEKDIILPIGARDWEWWLNDENLYMENFEGAGFEVVRDLSDIREGDVFFATLGKSKVPNHGGVYIGNGLALHHLTSRYGFDPSRVSKREPIARYMNHISLWLRHEQLA